ncbi:MAG: L,D-transpeptidase [Tannerella sp.]|jgi:hypothetical protein|nr:L,D-transpeptidase [Tannerella sp.]
MNTHSFSHIRGTNLKVLACGVCAVFWSFGCSPNGRRSAEAPEPVAAADTTTAVVCDTLAEISRLSAEILEDFPCWTIDSAGCEGVTDGVARFKIKGRATEKVPARTMRIQSDTATTRILSYIILRDMEKGKPFAFDALCIPDAGTVVICPDRRDGEHEDDEIDLILVSKRDLRLRALDYDDGPLLTVPAATGVNPGNKKRPGDKKTPEGIFSVYAIHDASEWDYDFHDGKGRIKGCYGKYFVRFREHYHIGIHGTHRPETVGSRATEACVRLRNEDIERIVPMISVSETLIAVTPAYEDVIAR